IGHRCREPILLSSRNPVVPGHPNDISCSRSRAPQPVHTTVEQVLTVLIITAVDSVDGRHHRRSYGSRPPWTDRGGLSGRRGPSVHDEPTAPDSCHSTVHIGSCADACRSTVSTELSTIGENSALTSIVLHSDKNRSAARGRRRRSCGTRPAEAPAAITAAGSLPGRGARALDAGRELGDLVEDRPTLLHQLADLLVGVHHRGVIAPAELVADP